MIISAVSMRMPIIGFVSNIDIYKTFIASDITLQLAYKKLALTGKNMLMNSLNGNIIGDFNFYESNNKLKLVSNINLKELNIRNTFLAFDNFKQDFITAKHIKGIGTAEIKMQAAASIFAQANALFSQRNYVDELL